MNSILKKSLLAASIAASCAANAAVVIPVDLDAVTMGNQVPSISAEGFAADGEIVVGVPVAVAGPANPASNMLPIVVQPEFINYEDTDNVEFTISGASIDTTQTTLSTLRLSVFDVNDVTNGVLDTSTNGTIDTTDGNGAIMYAPVAAPIASVATGFSIDAAAGVIIMDLNQTGGGFNAIIADTVLDPTDVVLVLTGVVLEEEGAGNAISVSYRGVRGETGFDQAPATTIATVGTQLAATVSDPFDASINVEVARQEFVADAMANVTATSSALDIAITDVTSASAYLAVTPTTSELVITGSNFDFVTDEDGDLVAARVTSPNATPAFDDDGAVVLDYSSTNTSLPSVATATTVTFTQLPRTDADVVALVPQTFTGDLEVDYTSPGSNNETATFSDLALGSWDLSGANVNIPFMPYGAGISQVIHISNDGNVTGDIELTAFDDAGDTFGPVTLDVQAVAGTVTRINGSIIRALAAEGFDLSGNLDISLSVNSPSADIEVFGAYNVRGDRIGVTVQNP